MKNKEESRLNKDDSSVKEIGATDEKVSTKIVDQDVENLEERSEMTDQNIENLEETSEITDQNVENLEETNEITDQNVECLDNANEGSLEKAQTTVQDNIDLIVADDIEEDDLEDF